MTSNERVILKAAADLRAAMTFAWRDYDSLKSALDQASRKVRQVIATLERSAVETSEPPVFRSGRVCNCREYPRWAEECSKCLFERPAVEPEAFTPSQIGQIIADNCEPCCNPCTKWDEDGLCVTCGTSIPAEKSSCDDGCICPRQDESGDIIYTHVACPVHALGKT